MAEEFTGKKTTEEEMSRIPEDKKGKGLEKSSDVEGQHMIIYVNCWRCGYLNSVDDCWNGFYCYGCGVGNSKW